ncbi:MAG: 30S ribosomal protein S6--L-glutamate ligase [Bacteroidia bacterium]
MKIAILSRSKLIHSTRRLIEAADQRGHEVEVVDHLKCAVMMETGKPTVFFDGRSLEDVDAVIPRIGASVTFYGCAIVRQFEMMGLTLANGSQGILRSRDKLRSIQLLSREGCPVPKTAFARHTVDVNELIKYVGGAPLVVKLVEGTQGLGVVLCETKKAAKSVIEAFYALEANILIQEFIEEAKGTDIRAFVVDGEVVGAMERKGPEGEFRSNLHRGGTARAVELDDEMRATAIKAAAAMGLNVAGVDMLPSKRGPLIMEVNSSPGLEGIERATGVDIAGKIVQFMERQHRNKVVRDTTHF